MKRARIALALVCCATSLPVWLQAQNAAASGHYMFAWTGDAAYKGKDFLAVIDADPKSASYGRLVTTVATDQQTMMVHHTEYTMPAGGMLFANDHMAGRTFIFDLLDPLHPKVAASFGDMAGYMHPHSYLRLPNGHVLATFQHAHHSESQGLGKSGGLVEIDDQGKVIRASGSADPAFSGALLTPYSLIVLPELDRVVSTNSSMHDEDFFRGLTYQVWRLSDLKLLKTAYFDTGQDHYGQISPEEPRLGPDGSIYVQTLSCGIERITAVDTDKPESRLVHLFPGSMCGVPTIVGHLPDSERSRDEWPDRTRHRGWAEARRGITAEAQRCLLPALDRMGREDAAAGSELQLFQGPGLSSETGPVDGRPHHRRCFSRYGRAGWL